MQARYTKANIRAASDAQRLFLNNSNESDMRITIIEDMTNPHPISCHANKAQRLTIIRSAINIFLP